MSCPPDLRNGIDALEKFRNECYERAYKTGIPRERINRDYYNKIASRFGKPLADNLARCPTAMRREIKRLEEGLDINMVGVLVMLISDDEVRTTKVFLDNLIMAHGTIKYMPMERMSTIDLFKLITLYRNS